MPARQHGAAHGGDPVNLRQLLVGLGEVAELHRGVRSPQVTPQCRDRVACRPPEGHRLAAEFEPLGDGLRDGDRQVPCGQGFEDCLRVAGPLGLGKRLRGRLGRARAAFALRNPDGELRLQACAAGVLVRRKRGQGALADPGDGAVAPMPWTTRPACASRSALPAAAARSAAAAQLLTLRSTALARNWASASRMSSRACSTSSPAA
jgi:hypothetical protein